jgi:hypothetical protein
MNYATTYATATARPTISVVMPALNAGATIGEALDGLAGQGDQIEVIVADGGSDDETLAVAQAYSFVRVLAAPGSTIYEALNLALAAARAPVVAWLNADDLFLPGALAMALDAFARAPDAEIVRGLPQFIRSGDNGWQAHEASIEARADKALDLELITRGPLAINSMVFRRDLLERVGAFDVTLRLAADREWMLRAWCGGARIVELGRPLYCYRVHRGSSTLDPGRRNHARVRDEHAAILARVLPSALRLAGDDPMRMALRRWHAVESALRIHGAFADGRMRQAVRLWGDAGRADPAWPLVLAGEIIRRWRR